MNGKGLPIRKAFPKVLIKNHFLIEIPLRSEEEEEEGLIESEVVDNVELKVVMVGEAMASVAVGDEVMMSAQNPPIDGFKIKDKAYFVYNEHSVIGIW